ncbi:DNA-processing protein DprA [Microbulbifer sp. TYP-18]|uniref:DNA-processing protein DprA n=1 Tax=Microbulbifer sp. TYP-18 TaxID=3230024 RepID=UPI0034C64F92
MDAITASLALLRLEGLGPGRYWQLVEHFGSAAQALHQLPPALLQKLPQRAQQQWRDFASMGDSSPLLCWAADERERCCASGVILLAAGSAEYPPLLAQIQRPPPILYVRGNTHAVHLPQIAVVGARRATSGGVDNAMAFAAELCSAGFAVTSGLALGIDAAAHRGALRVEGTTLAVLGSGVDHLYPRRNQGLAKDIIDSGGAIISELPLGSNAEAAHFPRRNRIISGLSLGVLLVEAARHSGSLITARLAAEQNREVFAIPGSIHNPMARGCHRMIKEGAALVETAADIASQLGGLLSLPTAPAPAAGPLLAPQQIHLLQALVGEPRSLEQLAQQTGEEAGTLMANLVQLELEGLVEQLPGGYQLTRAGAVCLDSSAEATV